MNAIRAALKWLQKNLSRRELICLCLIAGLCVGMLAHGFMFANKIPNHDDLYYYADLDNAGLHSGRYFLHFFWKLFSDLSTPWLNGILGVTFLCLASFFLCEAFDVRSRGGALAMILLIQAYPVNVSIYCYMYEAHVFMLGLMLATLPAWLIKTQKGWLRYLLAAGAVVMTTGIYQVFMMYAIGLLILLVIRETAVCAGEKSAGKVWGFAVLCAAVAVAGLLLYMIGLKCIQTVGHIQLNDYQGIDQTGSLSLGLIPQKIADAYSKVWGFYVARTPAYVSGRMQIFRLPLAVMGVAALAVSAVRCFVRRAPMHGVLLIVCALILPMACCGIYFMGDEIDMIHMITMYPLLLILILPSALIAPKEKGALRNAAALAMLCLYLGYGFQCVILDNQAYYRHYLSFTRAQHTAERMAMRIEELPEYQPGTKIAVAGYMNAEQSLVYFEYDVASRFLPFVGMRMELDYFWDYCLPNLLSRVIGLPVTGAGDDWEPTEEQVQAIRSMPRYPASGSIAFVDDVCIVKLSDEEY